MQRNYKRTVPNRWKMTSPQKPIEYKGQRITQDNSALSKNTSPYPVRSLQVCKFQSRQRFKNKLLIKWIYIRKRDTSHWIRIRKAATEITARVQLPISGLKKDNKHIQNMFRIPSDSNHIFLITVMIHSTIINSTVPDLTSFLNNLDFLFLNIDSRTLQTTIYKWNTLPKSFNTS